MARLIKPQSSSCRLNAVAVSWALALDRRALARSPQFLFPGSEAGFFPTQQFRFRRQPKWCGRISAVLDEPILRVCCRAIRGTNACKISHDAETSGGLRNDRIRRARGSGRSASAVPGPGAAAQRGLGGLETGDARTASGALRSASSCLPGRGGDTQLRKQQSRVMQHFCAIAELGGAAPPRGGTGSRQCLCRAPASAI